MKKRLIYIFLFALTVSVGLSQEMLRPLNTNLNYIYNDLNATGRMPGAVSAQKSQTVATLFLPFMDDFAYADTSNYPDPTKWADSSVYINTGYPIAPPSIGVASFDGLNKYGYPYMPNLVNLSVSLPADTLTSAAINLSTTATSQTLQPTDSVALTFYYQARGYGEAPELNDSLIVDFYKPAQKKWQKRVWFKIGTNNPNINDTVFKYVFIWASDTAYLHEGFRFRFRSKGSPTGNFDNWHVDYVYMDKSMSQVAVPNYNDLTFAYVPTPYLQYYSAMPYKQYTGTDMALKNLVKIKNNYNQAMNVTYECRFFDKNNSQVHFYTGNSNILGPFNPGGYSTFANHANPQFNYTFPAQPDSGDYRIEHTLYKSGASVELFNDNNRVVQYQRFRNYYALDDGSAEAGYYINTTAGKMAVKTIVNAADSFIAVRIYIDPVGKIQASETSKGFRINIWRPSEGNPNVPGDLMYQDTIFKPRYHTKKSNNTFSEYNLRFHQWLTPGIYYIGIQQFSIENPSDIITVGFDRNTDHRDVMFYDSGAGWTQSNIAGSVMIRPVFGAQLLPPVGLDETNNEHHTIAVFPNPASSQVTLLSQDNTPLTWSIMNSLGQEVMNGWTDAPRSVIESGDLSNGIYFLILKSNGRLVQQSKLIIQH